MAEKCFLVLDQGSSSSRAFAVSASGAILARAQKPLLPSFPRQGWAEYDPDALLSSQLAVLDEVLAQLPPRMKPVSLGITSQRSTVLLWDADTGRCVCPALSWQDGRALQQLGLLSMGNSALFSITGLYKTPYFSAPKIRWCLDNYPEAAELLAKGRLRAGPVTSYLLWHLSGGKVFVVDPSLAQRMLLFNIRTGDWDASLLEAFSLPRTMLPEVKPSFGAMAVLNRNGLELPVSVCLGDQQAALCGAGGWRHGVSVINYGTGAFFLSNTGSQACLVHGLLCSAGWADSAGALSYLAEGTVHSASSMFDWLMQIGLDFKKSDIDALYAQSKHPILALPALGGLGSPHWDYGVGTTMAGFTPHTTKADIVRGVVEGIAFLVSDIALPLALAGVSLDSIVASGGLANLDCLLQFQADILQKPVRRAAETETSALGVAYWQAL
ncbi:MAG: glycerol kinase [Elusimicrobia bacterium]|nr:glycerol kinase [Elusimicrobiota bacterium]